MVLAGDDLFFIFICFVEEREGAEDVRVDDNKTSLFLLRYHNDDDEVVYPVIVSVADWAVVLTACLAAGEERREKREERKDKKNY